MGSAVKPNVVEARWLVRQVVSLLWTVIRVLVAGQRIWLVEGPGHGVGEGVVGAGGGGGRNLFASGVAGAEGVGGDGGVGEAEEVGDEEGEVRAGEGRGWVEGVGGEEGGGARGGDGGEAGAGEFGQGARGRVGEEVVDVGVMDPHGVGRCSWSVLKIS